MAFTVQQAITEKIRHINEYRDAYMHDKFLFSNIEWDSNVDARNNINDAYDVVLALGEATPVNSITWRDYNNVDRPIPNIQFIIDMKMAMVEHYRLCHLAARWHKANVQSMLYTEPSGMVIMAYDFSGGWPNVTPV